MRRLHTPKLFAVVVVATALMGFVSSMFAHPVRAKDFPRAAGHAKASMANTAKKLEKSILSLRRQIGPVRRATWSWQGIVHRTPTRVADTPCESSRGMAYLQWCIKLWKKRLQDARHYAQNPPHKSQWLCIHRYEGSWTDPNEPYYGGLQMDREFQQTYGSRLYRTKGTADHWTPLEQMWVAEKAYPTRGFWPWPNTARYCGLL